MLYVLYTLFFLSCIVLVGSVLLQPGKTDAGALFTSNVSSNAFGPRGTATVLAKVTIAAAVIFMISALMISLPAFNGGTSVLNSAAETPAGAPADTNSNTEANPAASNTNSVLIQTPPVEQLNPEPSNSAAASNANNSASANAAVANTNASAPKKAAKPTPKK